MVALTGFGCRRENGPKVNADQPLVVWGLFHDSNVMDPVIEAFKAQTGIEVEYKKLANVGSYEQALLSALAEGRGPDVFVIHHTWVEGKRGLMAPAPTDIVNEKNVQEEFVDVVSKDLVRDGYVYALPTTVDSLSMYYNQNLLNAAGIARPPRTWQEFQRAIEQLTKVTRIGTIEQSGAAIGTAGNVNRAPDILQLLMMQSGLALIDPKTNTIDVAGEIGERALTFYTDFSNKSKKVYTWDLSQDYSIDSFAEGETAMMFNYSWHIPTIRAKNPRLQFAVAPMPQIGDSNPSQYKSLANYWPYAVSPNSKAPSAAWAFVRFMTNSDMSAEINKTVQAPPARRDGIEAVKNDPTIGVFAEQALIADSWPRVDVVAIDAIFNTMIDEVVTGATTIPDALRRAEDQIEKLGNESNT